MRANSRLAIGAGVAFLGAVVGALLLVEGGIKQGCVPLPEDDHSAVLQSVLDGRSFQRYLHSDLPERVPLVLSGPEETLAGLCVLVGGEKAVFQVPAPGQPYLEVKTLSIAEAGAIVVFQYRVEGLRGVYRLAKESKGWVIKDKELALR